MGTDLLSEHLELLTQKRKKLSIFLKWAITALIHKKGSYVFHTAMSQVKQNMGHVRPLKHPDCNIFVLFVESVGQNIGPFAKICQFSQLLTSSSNILIIILPHHLSHHSTWHIASRSALLLVSLVVYRLSFFIPTMNLSPSVHSLVLNTLWQLPSNQSWWVKVHWRNWEGRRKQKRSYGKQHHREK